MKDIFLLHSSNSYRTNRVQVDIVHLERLICAQALNLSSHVTETGGSIQTSH